MVVVDSSVNYGDLDPLAKDTLLVKLVNVCHVVYRVVGSRFASGRWHARHNGLQLDMF